MSQNKNQGRYYFGQNGDVSDPMKFFAENNYVVCRGATDLQAVDHFVDFYQSELIPSSRLYYRQSMNWERHKMTNAGGMANPLLNPHCYDRSSDRPLSDWILTILSFDGIHSALSEVAGADSFRLYQTMLFDHSTTRPHQDWIYLDTRPRGHLVAAWVALENIPETGIRFYVYPGTQHFEPTVRFKSEPGPAEYQRFLDEVDLMLEHWHGPVYAPPLKKGDIFFWGSRIVHGSVEGTAPDQRRRSIAAHFVPDGFGVGNLDLDFHHFQERKFGHMHYLYRNLEQPKFANRLRFGLDRIRQKLNP